MSSVTDLTQAQRSELRYVDPIQLVHITLPSGTILYFSEIDYVYTYASTTIYYDSYVNRITGLGAIVEVNTGIMNPNVRITLNNTKWSTYDHLIQLTNDDEFTRSDVAIYEVRVASLTETFSSDVRTCLWKGNIKQIEDITLESFTLACCSRLHNKKNTFGLQTINAEDFPNSHPPDRGKYRNKVYGVVDKLKTRCIKTGAIDKITIDMTASQTTVPLSGITQIPFTASGQVQIDEEIITYTGVNYSGTRPILLTGCTRATGSGSPYNVATVHDKGAYVGQVMTEFIYEIADHPVSAISNVFVDDVRNTDCATYTGQTGNELTGYEGTAVVRWTVQPYVGQQVNVGVSDHGHSTSTGLHAHNTSVTPTELWASRGTATEIITAPGTTHSVSNPTNAADEALGVANPVSSAFISTNVSYGIFYVGVNIPFSYTIPAGNTMTSIKIAYNVDSGSSDQYTGILYNGSTISTRTGILPKAWYEKTYAVARGAGTYSDSVRIVDLGSSDGSYTWLRVYEVQMAVYYSASPYTAYNEATGVDTSKVGTTSLSGGTSTSTIVIGNEVTADTQGYYDDALGTYTGTPSIVIQRPDHVFKHMLCSLSGFSLVDDIDATSFNTAGSYYSTHSYNYAFPIHDIGTEADKICNDLAYQIHSQLWEWGGKFYLVRLPSTTPTSNLTIYDEDIEKYPSYSFTNLDEIKNKIRCFYLRDYRDSGGSSLEGVLNADAMAEGYMDILIDSISPADLEDDLHLKAIRNSTAAASILAFWLNYKSAIKLSVNDIKLRWKAIQIGPGQYFTYTDPMFGEKIFRVTKYSPDKTSGLISISGIEAP